MSRALKCDRCGRLYECYVGVEMTKGGNRYYGCSLENSITCRQFDLCPVCMTKLVNFINNSECEQDMEAME